MVYTCINIIKKENASDIIKASPGSTQSSTHPGPKWPCEYKYDTFPSTIYYYPH